MLENLFYKIFTSINRTNRFNHYFYVFELSEDFAIVNDIIAKDSFSKSYRQNFLDLHLVYSEYSKELKLILELTPFKKQEEVLSYCKQMIIKLNERLTFFKDFVEFRKETLSNNFIQRPLALTLQSDNAPKLTVTEYFLLAEKVLQSILYIINQWISKLDTESVEGKIPVPTKLLFLQHSGLLDKIFDNKSTQNLKLSNRKLSEILAKIMNEDKENVNVQLSYMLSMRVGKKAPSAFKPQMISSAISMLQECGFDTTKLEKFLP